MTIHEEYEQIKAKQLKLIKQYLKITKQINFVKGYKATDQEAMGLIVSHYFEWRPIEIMETCANALEDANLHTETEVVRQWIETYKLSQ